MLKCTLIIAKSSSTYGGIKTHAQQRGSSNTFSLLLLFDLRLAINYNTLSSHH